MGKEKNRALSEAMRAIALERYATMSEAQRKEQTAPARAAQGAWWSSLTDEQRAAHIARAVAGRHAKEEKPPRGS